MSDEDASGTSISMILIVVAVLVIAGVTIYGAFPQVREQFNEALNIGEDVFNKDEIDVSNEEKTAADIFKLFEELSKIEGNDCIEKLDLSSFSRKDFNIEFTDNKITIIKGDNIRVYPFTLTKSISFMRQSQSSNNFLITDDLTKINKEFNLGNFVYINNNQISVLDSFKADEFSEKYSPVFAKLVCGEKKKEEVKKLNIVATEGLKDKIEGGFSKSVSDIILHLWYIDNSGTLDNNKVDANIFYWNKLENELNNYYNSQFPLQSCWKYTILLSSEAGTRFTGTLKEYYQTKSFGNFQTPFGVNTEIHKVEVRENEPRDPRTIAKIELAYSTSPTCAKN